MRLVIFNYLIGNADAHGKNFSLLYKGEKPVLAPVYDLLSTIVYPNLAKKMAMKIGGKYDPDHVFIRHWMKMVPDTSLAQKALRKDIEKMCHDTWEKALIVKSELKKNDIQSDVIDQIITVIGKRSDQILM